MGIFRQFPYTNFHDLNLDWVIGRVKELSAEWLSVSENWDKWQNDIDKALTDLEKYVNEYFKDLPLEAVISDILNEMVAQGVLPFLQPKNITPFMFKYGQLLDDWVNANTNKRAAFQSIIWDNITNKYYSAGNLINTNQQVITEWSEQGEILNYHYFTEIGHPNGMAIDNNNIYIADSDNNIFYIINKQTYQITESLDVSDTMLLRGCATFNGDIYLLGLNPNNFDDGLIYKYINNAIELQIQFLDPDNNVRQGFFIHEEIAYLCRNGSNQIIGININSGDKTGHYNIADGDNTFPLGELESCFVKDGVLCIAGAIGIAGRTGALANKTQALSMLFKTSIISYLEGSESRSYGTTTAYTNITVNGNNPKQFNPTINQFTTLDEAGAVASYLKNCTIAISNINKPQMLYLVDGSYNIHAPTAAGDNKEITGAFINAEVVIRNANLDDIEFANSNIICCYAKLKTKLTATQSVLKFNNCEFLLSACNIGGMSPIEFNECIFTNPLDSYTRGNRVYSTITGQYSNNLANYLRLFNARYYLSVITANEGMTTCVLSTSDINSMNWTKSARNNDSISQIKCTNGAISITVNGVERALTLGDLISLIPCAG